MPNPRALRVFGVLLAIYAALTLPALAWPGYLDSPLGLIVAIPFLSVYLFHSLGVPGVLQRGGACEWGWCPPSVLGWVLMVSLWLILGWLLAVAIAKIAPGKGGSSRR